MPKILKIEATNVEITEEIKTEIRETLESGAKGTAIFQMSIGEIRKEDLTETNKILLNNDEAFSIDLEPTKIKLIGRTHEAILRGIATMALLGIRARAVASNEIPLMTLYDAPRLKFRGWVHNINGLTLREIKEGINLGFRLRYNKVVIPLDSYTGPTVFPFETIPIGGKALTKTDLVNIFSYARSRGIEPIPYFSIYNRVMYLANAKNGKSMYVDDIDIKNYKSRNLNIANPDILKTALAMQEEIINTLHPRAFFIALDEVHYANTTTSNEAKAKAWKPSDWFIQAVRASYRLFKEKEVELILWGDMIDPDYNGKHMDKSGQELINQLPSDISVVDWKYDGTKDETEDLPSVRMFRHSNIKTIGGVWFRPHSITRMARAVHKEGANGMLLTAWNNTSINQMPVEFIRALSLTSYYSWSPEEAQFSRLTIVPDVLVHAAGYWPKLPQTPLQFKELKFHDKLLTGSQLANELGIQGDCDTPFFDAKVTNYFGAPYVPFERKGFPGAIMITKQYLSALPKSGDNEISINVNTKARTVTFFHATNQQTFVENELTKPKGGAQNDIGWYQIHFKSGKLVKIELKFRENITAINDPFLPRNADVGVFRAGSSQQFINIQSYTWNNKVEEDEITRISFHPGRREDVRVAIFGLTLGY